MSNARISRNSYKKSDHSREENPFYSEIWTFYVAIDTFSQVKQCKIFDKLQYCSSCLSSSPDSDPIEGRNCALMRYLAEKNERQIFIKPIDSSLLTWPLDFNFKPIFLLHWNIYERKTRRLFDWESSSQCVSHSHSEATKRSSCWYQFSIILPITM